MTELCSPPNIDPQIAIDLANDNPAPNACHLSSEQIEELVGWIPGQSSELPLLIDSTSSLPEHLEVLNLCQSPDTICWLESDPDSPIATKLSVKFGSPKNFDWIMASLKATLQPLKVEFDNFYLQQNFTNPVVAPSYSASQPDWNQKIKTTPFTKLEFDVTLENDLYMVILQIDKKTNVTITLDQFINDIIDHPCSQKSLQDPDCQLALQAIASQYPLPADSLFSFAYGFSPDNLPTDDQTIVAILTADETGEFIELNDDVRFDIKDENGDIIGEVVIPTKDWQTIQDGLKTDAEKKSDNIQNILHLIPSTLLCGAILGSFLIALRQWDKKQTAKSQQKD